ncbi:hypothetical protein GHO41_07305 [Pseudomonas sp. FSL R10-0399]|uniref:DNA circularization protein n=1 Tax=Pseudomonas sp. FSL R10-0399 TaxID=2662194 RepID=UPI00129672CB|nr:DNA circularization N-terminal domain-containing protein [Pseudomonas sp. FSL R10-0399]MQT57155.1 hypothetical protein [Pseudomonas sp. FSL R10-0399]
MSEWRDRKQGASFRGVPFWLDTDSVNVGRRTQVHEYPQRDQPYVEDLGRRTRQYKFSGFVVGDDCLTQRDKLLTALDTPGAGELVHPWFGRLTVTAGDCEVSHVRNEQGMVRFSMVFIDGMLAFPVQSANTRRLLAEQSPGLLESAKGRFDDAMGKVDLARQRISAVRSAVSSAYAFGIGLLKPFSSVVADLDAFVYSILNAPGALSSSLLGGIMGGERTFSGYGADGSFSGSSAKASAVSTLQASAPVTDNEDVATIQAAVIGLVQDAALLDLLQDMAQVPIAVNAGVSDPADLDVQLAQQGATVEAGSSVETTIPVADDVLDARDAISDALWSVAGDSQPEHFGVLSGVRLALDRHLTEVARSGVGLRTYAPIETVSSLVLAHALYGDALRSGEIVTRNRVRHPGFVPATELQVAKA